ncbi:hypothetical protein AQUCO_06000030v1 [Aquilegia coerulea]|uniref:Uncharacterized protein n=1 Tax=Aquilegia coerulea TaxID=218851 RepID=A0A2G5CDM0_AQUCA|nr:hypothetical protein AQUCO_06000030v1 [Aquilegia coerulea]
MIPSRRAKVYANKANNLMSSIKKCNLTYIYRESNRCANYLDSLSTKEDKLSMFYTSLSKQLENIIIQITDIYLYYSSKLSMLYSSSGHN